MRSIAAAGRPPSCAAHAVVVALVVAGIVAGAARLLLGWAGDAVLAAPAGAAIAAIGWGVWGAAAAIAISRCRAIGAGGAWLAVGWGATAAAVLADAADQWWPTSSTLDVWPLDRAWFAQAVVAPIDEEAMKALGVLLILLATQHARIGGRTGARIGMLVGLGFTLVEGWAYSMDGIVHDHHDVRDLARELTLRGVVSVPVGHIAFSGLAGLGLGLILSSRGRDRRRTLAGFGACLLAVVAHGLHDSPWTSRASPAAVVVGALTLAPAVVLVLAARRRRDRVPSSRPAATSPSA